MKRHAWLVILIVFTLLVIDLAPTYMANAQFTDDTRYLGTFTFTEANFCSGHYTLAPSGTGPTSGTTEIRVQVGVYYPGTVGVTVVDNRYWTIDWSHPPILQGTSPATFPSDTISGITYTATIREGGLTYLVKATGMYAESANCGAGSPVGQDPPISGGSAATSWNPGDGRVSGHEADALAVYCDQPNRVRVWGIVDSIGFPLVEFGPSEVVAAITYGLEEHLGEHGTVTLHGWGSGHLTLVWYGNTEAGEPAVFSKQFQCSNFDFIENVLNPGDLLYERARAFIEHNTSTANLATNVAFMGKVRLDSLAGVLPSGGDLVCFAISPFTEQGSDSIDKVDSICAYIDLATLSPVAALEAAIDPQGFSDRLGRLAPSCVAAWIVGLEDVPFCAMP